MPNQLISFGFKFGGPNSALGDVIDVRTWFQRNPFRLKHLRGLRGDDPAVMADIEATPGFAESYTALLHRVGKSQRSTVFLGCTAGHHRSVYLTNRIAKDLGIQAAHRDYDKE